MINGILNLYKERGYTSHDAVACLRKITGQKKIGHTGTLDPAAEGVLPICLGRAAKLCAMLTDHDKTYETVLLLGVETDTQDSTGKVLDMRDTGALTEERVKKAIQGFVGEYEQVPPMYSAKKVNGKKLYELAREGKTVERAPRKVTVYSIEITAVELPRVWMTVHCSAGTYIRTLCSDIGAGLGVFGCMDSLKRTRVGNFSVKDSVRLDEVQAAAEAGEFIRLLTPMDALFADNKKAVIAGRYAPAAYNGNSFSLRCLTEPLDFAEGETCRLYDEQGHFIGLYRCTGDGLLHVQKMLLDPEELVR